VIEAVAENHFGVVDSVCATVAKLPEATLHYFEDRL
jgi:hypothetical protein